MEKLQLLVLKEQTSILDSGTLFYVNHTFAFLGEKNYEGSDGWSASWRSKAAAAELVIRYLVHTRAT